MIDMLDYIPSDLTSTLVYIKNRFGISAFIKNGRVSALLSDLAPSLKSDRAMLERMSRIGILEEFANNIDTDESTKKRLISKSMAQLTQSEYIRPTIAASYLRILVDVFGWNIEVEIPRESSYEKTKFDSKRYAEESQDREFIMAKKAYNLEEFSEARLLFSKSYGKGNILAGVMLGIIYYSGKGCEHNYEKALPLFVDGMNRGCPLGASWLAYAYKNGRGVPKDKEKAKEIYDSCVDALEEMCVSGSADAQYAYGFDLLYGNFVKQDNEKALYWLEKSMKAGQISAGVQVAKAYLYGWGCDTDEKKGVELLEKYAGTTNINAHYELGKAFYYGKVKEKNYRKALQHFLQSAEDGHANSQDYVGDIYYYGKGVEKDYTEARKWYEMAERQGNKSASKTLGFIYFFGEGITKDKDKAFSYFKYAADKGEACAQYMLHNFYLFDEKYRDYQIGRDYLEKSAEQGYVLAQKLLARCYIGSLGFDEDDKKFVYWMRKAAEQGDAEAQRILGEAYIKLENEDALPMSYPDAIKWLCIAADQGDIQALILLAEVYSSGEGVDKDNHKATSYIQQAEIRLKESEKNGKPMIEEHEKIAELYYKCYKDKANHQLAFEHYCIAFTAGKRSVSYDVGWMYFINGHTSGQLKVNTEELLLILKEEEGKTKSSSLAYLLGRIYEKGYVEQNNPKDEEKSQSSDYIFEFLNWDWSVAPDEKEAEKWYLQAIEKGSISARCKLAFYYVNKCKLYDKGFKLLEEAYEHGSIEGTRLLGLCYKNGIGVKKNRSKAKSLLKEAASNGDVDAAEELKKFIF